jgi:hypothetical protein
MKIISVPDGQITSETYKLIVAAMINTEASIKVLNDDCTPTNGSEWYNTVQLHDDIKANMRGTYGTLVVVGQHEIYNKKAFIDSIVSRVDEICAIRPNLYSPLNTDSVDFVESTGGPSSVKRMINISSNRRKRTNYTFVWDVVSAIPCMAHTAYDMVTEVLTVVVDIGNVFNTPKNKVLHVDGRGIPYNLFRAYDNVVKHDVISVYPKEYGGVIPYIYGLCNSPLPSYSIDVGLNRVYREAWENINPRRVVADHVYSKPDLKKALTDTHYNYTFSELTELRNVACGAPPSYNDRCRVCKMYLFGEIYAIEANGSHVCICPYCIGHAVSVLDEVKCTLLRTTYPRELRDVLQTKPAAKLTSDVIDVLVQLYTDGMWANTENNYAIIKNVRSYLYAGDMKDIDVRRVQAVYSY